MSRQGAGRLSSVYVFCVKATGIAGLAFVPFLAFGVASGLVAVPQLLAPALALTLLGVLSSLVMVSDSGLARRVLRPASIGGALLGFLVLGLLTALVVGQAVLSLLTFDMVRFLALVGVDPRIAPVLLVVFLAPPILLASLASLLVLIARFDADQPPLEAAATPTRVRPAEHEAAQRAMRRRMAQRRSVAQEAA